MKNIIAIFSLSFIIFTSTNFFMAQSSMAQNKQRKVILPQPDEKGTIPLETTMALRRSVRVYQDSSLSLKELSQILWAAQGINNPVGLRTVPSAGTTFPITVYVIVGKVDEIEPAIYTYNPYLNHLIEVAQGDFRKELTEFASNQIMIENAPVSIVFVAYWKKIKDKYPDRAIRYTYQESGHSAQNVYLQCVSLNLGTCAIGAFDDNKVKQLLKLNKDQDPLYIMSIGRKTK